MREHSIFRLASNDEAAEKLMALRPDFLGEIDESRLVGRFRDDLTDGDKLALKIFMMQEFDLEQIEVLQRGAEVRTVVERREALRSRIDLLGLHAAVLRGCEPALAVRLLELVSPRGIVCIDTDSQLGQPDAGLLPDSAFEWVMLSDDFAVFARSDGDRSPRSLRYQIDLFRRRRHVARRRQERLSTGPKIPEVAVFVLTYRHEAFIADCLRSILRQRGQFTMRVLIIDDASPDSTAEVARAVIAEHRNDNVEVELRVNPRNTGASANWAPALTWAEGADYVAPCGGGDFWSSDDRIQEHIDFLRNWPNAVMSFNSVTTSFAVVTERMIGGSEIIEDDPIVSPGCTFYLGIMAEVIPSESLLQIDDGNENWTLSIYSSQFGSIGHLNKAHTQSQTNSAVTRRDSSWSESEIAKTINAVAARDSLLDFNYTDDFRRVVEFCYSTLGDLVSYNDWESKNIDLIVLDDTFPTSKNGFRYLEYTFYLKQFQSCLVLSTGQATELVDKTPHDILIKKYQHKFPDIGNRVIAKRGKFPLHLAKLVYIMFLHNTYGMLPEIEEAGVQFIFTLYPGGGFALNNPDVDRKLARVFDSPFFKKVIVTQRVIYDYITRNDLCPKDKIEVIYGGVMPEAPDPNQFPKRRWGTEKTQLDICFMAHKYTPRGEDKGYDMFVEVAKILRQHHDNIYFHVAGGFDQHVIDVRSLGDRIKFYGPLGPDAIDDFFKDMDIILSPNISGKIYSGSTDGFPTGCCVDAGMRGTAIFATDEFDSAKRCYIDGEDIVLVDYDVTDIVDKIERYYEDPEALRSIGESGSRTVRDIHRLDAQMAPRVDLLRKAIGEPAPAGEAVALRVQVASLKSEIELLNEKLAVETWRNRKLKLLLRSLWRLLLGRSDATIRQIFEVYRSAGFRGVRRALREIGS